MKRIRQFLALSLTDRALLVRAVAVVTTARFALTFMSFRRVRRMMEPRRISRQLANIPVRHLSWAVQAAGRRIPGTTCLVQALALSRLMARAGHAGTLRIGVARGDALGIDAHAWVQHGEVVILGDHGDLGRYATILTWGATEARA